MRVLWASVAAGIYELVINLMVLMKLNKNEMNLMK